MARTTTDPDVAAGLISKAADLKDGIGELPAPASEIILGASDAQEGN
jgi:hypothetical protein